MTRGWSRIWRLLVAPPSGGERTAVTVLTLLLVVGFGQVRTTADAWHCARLVHEAEHAAAEVEVALGRHHSAAGDDFAAVRMPLPRAMHRSVSVRAFGLPAPRAPGLA